LLTHKIKENDLADMYRVVVVHACVGYLLYLFLFNRKIDYLGSFLKQNFLAQHYSLVWSQVCMVIYHR